LTLGGNYRRLVRAQGFKSLDRRVDWFLEGTIVDWLGRWASNPALDRRVDWFLEGTIVEWIGRWASNPLIAGLIDSWRELSSIG